MERKPHHKHPDNRWKQAKAPEQTELQNAEELAQIVLGSRRADDPQTERWKVVQKWRGLYSIAIEFVAPHGTEIFVYENPTQRAGKVLHRVNFEPQHDPNGRIVSISSLDLRTREDIPKNNPLLNPPTPAEQSSRQS